MIVINFVNILFDYFDNSRKTLQLGRFWHQQKADNFISTDDNFTADKINVAKRKRIFRFA